MTLNEHSMGGNPRLLLLLFCVILICYARICPSMIQKRKKNIGGHDNKLGTVVPVQTHQKNNPKNKSWIPS